jgi:hypothetical protein
MPPISPLRLKNFADLNPHGYISTVIDRVLSVKTTQRHKAQDNNPGGIMLVRTNTLWNDLAEVQNEFDRLFRRGLGDGVSGHFPPVNIAENDDAYVIQARVYRAWRKTISLSNSRVANSRSAASTNVSKPNMPAKSAQLADSSVHSHFATLWRLTRSKPLSKTVF